ncbi:MAG: PKD domain-containing protein, partial [Candidatus Sigynarchaeota archaeon]
NASIGDFQVEEMARDGEAFYVVGGHDFFIRTGVITKVSRNGTVAWTRTFGRNDELNRAKDIAIFGDVVYVCGYLWHQGESQAEGYVGAWSKAGTQLWNYTWDANGYDYVEGIAADATGIYVTGQRPDTYQDLFVMKLRLDGRVPAPAIGKNVTGSPLSGDAIQFTAGGTTGDGPATRLWDFGDGTTSTATNPVHAFLAGGTYNVTLTVTDVDGSVGVASTIIVVVQDVAPVASFTASTRTPWTGTAVQFTYTGTPGNAPAAYLWTFGTGGPTSTVQDATFTFTSPGTYNVSLVVTDADGDAGRASMLVVVADKPGEAWPGPGGGATIAIAILAGIAAGGILGFVLIKRAIKNTPRHGNANDARRGGSTKKDC